MSSSSDLRPRPLAIFPPELVSGGTQRHVLEVLKFIDRERFRPLVVSAKSGGQLGRAVTACGVELVDLDLGPSMVSRDVVRCIRAAARVLRERRIEVVQYFEWRSGLIALAAARMVRGIGVVAGRRSVPQERGLRALVEELVVQRADRVVVNAEALRPRGRAGERTVVIPSGVDTERFQPRLAGAQARTLLGLPADRPVIGTVGRLEPRKGTATLIEAAALLAALGHDDVVVMVVGEGPLRAEMEARIAARGLDGRVWLLGDRADVRDVLAALDVFVLPSRTEGMSNALLEAMAMQRPVVATAVGGTPEVVAGDAYGLLVPPDEPAAMAHAIGELLAAPARARAMGQAARRRVLEGYGSRAMVRRLEAVYAATGRGAPTDGRAIGAVPTPDLRSLEECP